MITQDGFTIFGFDPKVANWANAARQVGERLLANPAIAAPQMRHQNTWFVGVDVLPNPADGSIEGVPLAGPWQEHVPALPLHRAQLSVVYPGYPKRDPDETLANHKYRLSRRAAHVDGLLPHGPNKRRYAQEFHSYILGLPLNDCETAPTVVWRGSHKIMQAALQAAIGDQAPDTVDITEAYQEARREVFETCSMVPLHLKPGEAMLLHRFALHGTEAWNDGSSQERVAHRMIAFFRPECAGGAAEWLASE